MTTTTPETAMTDWRALCVELVSALADFTPFSNQEANARARAALAAEPVAEGEAIGPSIEAVGSLIAWLSEQACQAADAGQPTDAGMLTWAAQVIGEQVDEDAPAPPAEGEVGELAAKLRRLAPHNPLGTADPTITRAADLLEQRHPAPVPVSERLPGDALCWWFEADEDCGYGSNWTLLRIRGSATGYTHWLPATALPLPAGEVQP